MKAVEVINRLIEGYNTRNSDEIDTFMENFSNENDSQMIGIGATVPGEYEWFTGKNEIKEIVISDWTNWGKVHFDLESLRLTERKETAWFSICATLEQVEMNEETWLFFLSQMKDLLDDKTMKAADRMFEASHFGIRRVREKNLGVGHPYKMIVTGNLVFEDAKWKVHSLHWSMPVE